MSDTTAAAIQSDDRPPEFVLDRAQDRARLRSVAGIHFVMVMGALTLWGAADSWSASSGWGLAWLVALANAVIAGYVISSTLHEWGHYLGARLSGAAAPVLEKPVRYFFMFNFKFEHNDARQFRWMSLGGILTPWLLVLGTLLAVPIDNASRAMLLAVFASRAIAVSVFEVPVVLQAERSGDPAESLNRRLKAGSLRTSQHVGLASAAAIWLLAPAL